MPDTQDGVVEGGVYGRRSAALRDAVERAVPFRNANGNLRGIEGRHNSTGRLNPDEAHAYRTDDVVFTVLSFDTPIAWLRSNGAAHYVGQYMSPTTARHLAVVQGLGKQRQS